MVQVDTTEHNIDEELTIGCKQEVAVWAYLMTQLNLKPGLQKFGERGAKAAVSQLMQLHITDTWTVMDPEQLTKEDKARALLSLLFLKEKQYGKIKGQACINGAPQPQRVYFPKEDAASPTVSTTLISITLAIAASERRHVRCHGIPSAFVSTDVDKSVLMVLKGKLAEMMVQIVPQVHQKHIMVNKK
jgi:hypothetical protein